MSIMPVTSADSAPLWEGFAAGELRLPWCDDCGRSHLPPGPVCPYCLSTQISWRKATGVGTLSSFAVVHRPYFPDWPLPYIAVEVALAEGPRLSAAASLDDRKRLRVGLPITISFGELPNRRLLPVIVVPSKTNAT